MSRLPNTTTISTLALLTALAALPLRVAHAAGWDWEETGMWTQQTLNWAQTLDPDHPSVQVLQQQTAPAPLEPWCLQGGQPSPAECGEHEQRLENWKGSFLQGAMPASEPPFPAQCAASCYPV